MTTRHSPASGVARSLKTLKAFAQLVVLGSQLDDIRAELRHLRDQSSELITRLSGDVGDLEDQISELPDSSRDLTEGLGQVVAETTAKTACCFRDDDRACRRGQRVGHGSPRSSMVGTSEGTSAAGALGPAAPFGGQP